MPADWLHKAGISAAKTRYAHALTAWVHANPGIAAPLSEMPNEDVISALTSIRGSGCWTADVFLIFNLKRLDVVPAADLSVRRGVQFAYWLPSLATPSQVTAKAQGWMPYQSIVSMYLWNAIKLKIKPESLSDVHEHGAITRRW